MPVDLISPGRSEDYLNASFPLLSHLSVETVTLFAPVTERSGGVYHRAQKNLSTGRDQAGGESGERPHSLCRSPQIPPQGLQAQGVASCALCRAQLILW